MVCSEPAIITPGRPQVDNVGYRHCYKSEQHGSWASGPRLHDGCCVTLCQQQSQPRVACYSASDPPVELKRCPACMTARQKDGRQTDRLARLTTCSFAVSDGRALASLDRVKMWESHRDEHCQPSGPSFRDILSPVWPFTASLAPSLPAPGYSDTRQVRRWQFCVRPGHWLHTRDRQESTSALAVLSLPCWLALSFLPVLLPMRTSGAAHLPGFSTTHRLSAFGNKSHGDKHSKSANTVSV